MAAGGIPLSPPPLTRQSAVYIPAVYVVYDAVGDGIGHLPGVNSIDGVYTQFTFIQLMNQALPIWRQEQGFDEDPMPMVDPMTDNDNIGLVNLVDWVGAHGIFDTRQDAVQESIAQGILCRSPLSSEDPSPPVEPPSAPARRLAPPSPFGAIGTPVRRRLTYGDLITTEVSRQLDFEPLAGPLTLDPDSTTSSVASDSPSSSPPPFRSISSSAPFSYFSTPF